MFKTPPITKLVNELPDRNLTTMMLRSLDIVAPGEWKNPNDFEAMVRNQSGETAKMRKAMIHTIAGDLYADPAHGYQKALWCYRTVDRADRLIAAASMVDKIGQKIDFLRFVRRLTPKSDTAQAVDLGLKLAAEGLAFGYLHGRPRDGVVEFGRSLAGYGQENLLRLGTLVCVDGIVPLGPDFAARAGDLLGKAKVPDLTSSKLYQHLRDALPGRSDSARLGAIRETWGSASKWLNDFRRSRDLNRENVSRRLSKIIRISDDKMDYFSAFLDVSTNYYSHTGTQSVARRVVDHAIAEAPREFFKSPEDFAERKDFPKKSMRQRQRAEVEAIKRRHEQEREDLLLIHRQQSEHFEAGRWDNLKNKSAYKVVSKKAKSTKKTTGKRRGGGTPTIRPKKSSR